MVEKSRRLRLTWQRTSLGGSYDFTAYTPSIATGAFCRTYRNVVPGSGVERWLWTAARGMGLVGKDFAETKLAACAAAEAALIGCA